MNKLNRFLFSSAILLALDFIYLNLVKEQYATQIVAIQRVVMKVKIIPAIVCYALLIIALNYFILRTHRPILEAFLLGFIIYGVFDATNYAIFKKWDLRLAISDAIWGGVLFALTTYFVYSF
jgi:uncharacterized membrane protein|tara:strand:- start:16112 stop:16477 length:366 start_codon:yes stop_codon:yes gene_type:complete